MQILKEKSSKNQFKDIPLKKPKKINGSYYSKIQ